MISFIYLFESPGKMAAFTQNMLMALGQKKILVNAVVGVQQTRNFNKRSWRPVLRELYRRRILQGPESQKPRSDQKNWNYDSEIYAFGKRLGENFSKNTLKQAFLDGSYIQRASVDIANLGVVDVDDKAEGSTEEASSSDNLGLSEKGGHIASTYTQGYLRLAFPALPEEGIRHISDYLMSEEVMAYVASHLGVKDLILCDEFPVGNKLLCKTLKAVIGGLAQDQGQERAQLFVQDFIITHLVGKNLEDIWPIKDPMGVLCGILKKLNRGSPTPRICWETGTETMIATYVVGIYSDKELIGQAPGETASIAEEMAARNALNRMFGLTRHSNPLPHGEKGRHLNINSLQSNKSLNELMLNHLQ